MSLFFTIAYALGFTPWEWAARRPDAERQILAIFDRAAHESPGGKPTRALDLGCGRGGWSVELSRRGWDVTGVDMVPRALRQARERARAAGEAPRFLQADITKLEKAGTGGNFAFIWDFGAQHGLTPAQLTATARGITGLSAPRAELVMMAFRPGKRGPGPRGLDEGEITAAYAGWDLLGSEPLAFEAGHRRLEEARPRLWRLRLR